MGIVLRPDPLQWRYWKERIERVISQISNAEKLVGSGFDPAICLNCRKVSIAPPGCKAHCPKCQKMTLTAKSDL